MWNLGYDKNERKKPINIWKKNPMATVFVLRRDQNTMNGGHEVRDMLIDVDIIITIKSRRISWAGHVWRAQKQLISEVTRDGHRDEWIVFRKILIC